MVGDLAHRPELPRDQPTMKPVACPSLRCLAALNPCQLLQVYLRAPLAYQIARFQLPLEKRAFVFAIPADPVLATCKGAVTVEDIEVDGVEIKAGGEIGIARRAAGVGVGTEAGTGPLANRVSAFRREDEFDFAGKWPVVANVGGWRHETSL